MRLTASYLFALLSLFSFSACDKVEEVTPEPEPVDKTVVFEVYGDQDFSYSRYGDEEVSITLLIRRQDRESMVETVVFDTTFTSALKDIPVRANRLVIKKTVPAVLAEKEYVYIGSGYSLMKSAFGRSEFLPGDETEKKVQLTIY